MLLNFRELFNNVLSGLSEGCVCVYLLPCIFPLSNAFGIGFSVIYVVFFLNVLPFRCI